VEERIMRRLAWGVALLLLAAGPAAGQGWEKDRLKKSPRHGEWVKLKHDNREVQAFIVFPEVKDKATAVVVIHEIFGLSDWVRVLADELAEAGYIAIAPDLLSGMGPKGGGTDSLGEGVRKAITSLPADQITKDLNAAADYVKKLPACNGKVAACGFCWGGGQVFRYATNNKDLKAAFVFYGMFPHKEQELARINCPVYGFYGGNDARINMSIPDSEKLMKAAGKKFEPVIYEGAGHGFMRAGDGPSASGANKTGHDQAWERWKKILKGI
jgi:carboxymethylenebutenolidase